MGASRPFVRGKEGTNGTPGHATSHSAVKAGCPKQSANSAWVRTSRSTQGGPVMGSADRTTMTWLRYWYEDKWIAILAKPELPGGRGRVYDSFKLPESEDVLMLTATVIRRLEALETISKQGKPINALFRLLENPIMCHEPFSNIYATPRTT